MIGEKYRFIYLHVPKTGGNSIQNVLLPFSDDRKTRSGHQDGIERFGISGPLTPRKHAVLEDYETASPGISKRMRVMVSIRHPFERAVSAYFSPHRWQQRGENGKFRTRMPEWREDDFLAFMADGKDLAPMISFLCVGNKVRVPDIVLRFETLKDDLKGAMSLLGLPKQAAQDVPYLNASADVASTLRRSVMSSNALRDKVETHFAKDMDVFDYPSYQASE